MRQVQQSPPIFIFILFFTLIGVADSTCQCIYPTQVAIADNDTSNITFVVRGAVNNNLNTNGICGVNLKFTHDYIGDISIYLVSPSGQEVQLLGPAVEASAITQFVNWDVTFVPCGITASPDPGLFAVWNNLGNWFQFNTYDGTYYPSNGCLEDLNTGPVNGNWTLRIEDAVEFGSGNIESASLVFCDDTGIQCASCVSNAGIFDRTLYTTCEGKEELKFYPDISFTGPVPPDNFYDYLFIILDVNGYVDLQDTVDLTDLNPATYQICGLSIEDSEINDLSITFGMKKDEIEELIFDRGLCADITNQCISYTIQDVVDTIHIYETLCTGETYNYNGQVYDSTGVYVLDYSGGNCDSVRILNLEYYNIQATIQAVGNPQLTCTNDRILLDGSSSFADGPLLFRWSTDNGYIRTPDTLSSIRVSHTGSYYLEIFSGACVSRDTFEVFGDGTNPEIRLLFDTVSCIVRSTLVELTSKGSYSSARWEGPTFSRSDDNITVSIAGEYYLTITTDNGCSIFDTANIIGDLDVEEPIFDVPDILCSDEIIQPNMTFADGTGLSFSWTGPNGFASNEQNPDIRVSGFYRVSILAENGCDEQHTIPVNDLRQYATVTTTADTITCNVTSVPVSAFSNIGNVGYSWEGPRGFTSTEQSPVVSSSGIYYLTVVTNQQCESYDTIAVQDDIIPPQLTATDITISCSDSGSIPLSVNSGDQIISYSWTGPGEFSATGPNPLASVIGRYQVTATGSNGCIASANLDIVPANDIPNITFVSDSIHCDNRSVSINPSLTNSLNFDYTFPDSSSSSDPNPIVDAAGIYSVRVSQGPCVADYLHKVIVDTVYPVIAFDVEEIDCDADSVTLDYISSRPLQSGLWEGPSMFSTDILNPFVDFPATFVFTGQAYNGCVSVDSVDVRENFNIPQLSPRNINFNCRTNVVTLQAPSSIPAMSYNWTGPNGFSSQATSPRTMTAGTYYVTVTGINGCVNNDSLKVAYDTVAPIVMLSVDTLLTCSDPEVTLSAMINETSVSTAWEGPTGNTPGGRTLNVQVPGKWKITVTDNAGCISADSIMVESAIVYPDIGINSTVITCLEPLTYIELTVDQFVDSIIWDSSSGFMNDMVSVNSSRAGIYTFTAIANNGCDSTYIFEVLSDTIPDSYSVSFSDTISCNNPTINLGPNPSANLTYFEWYYNNDLISDDRIVAVDQAGEYLFRGAGENGCFTEDTLVVPIDTISPIVETFPDTLTCRNPRPFLEFTTNITDPEILWTSSFGYSSDRIRSRTDRGGIYNLSVKDKNGCVTNASLSIVSDNSPPGIILDSITYLLCDGTPVSINLEALDSNLVFQWFYEANTYLGDSQNPIADTVGIYTVYVNGDNGCGLSETTRAVIDTRLPEFSTFTDILTCNNNPVKIGADLVTEDLVWEWIGPNGFTSNDTSFFTSDPGNYFLMVTRQNRCIDSATVVLSADTMPPDIIIEQNQIIQCENRIIEVDGSKSGSVNGATYAWTTSDGIILSGSNSPIATIQDPGNYQLKLVDNFSGCRDSLTIQVVETPQEFLDFELVVNNPTCAGYENGEIIISDYIGGYGPYSVSLDGGFFAEKDNIRFLSPGTYTIIVRDSLGCQITKDTIVEEPQPVFLSLGNDTLIMFGDSVRIFATSTIPLSSIAGVIWSTSDGLSCTDCLQPIARPTKTTKYKLTIFDENGCEASGEIIIRVDEEPDIYIPTIFSPNSSAGNEMFYIPQTRGIEQINYMSIYDRWGNRMYYKENFVPGVKNDGWDGRFQGQQVQPAVFIVITELKLINGENMTIVSDVTLLR